MIHKSVTVTPQVAIEKVEAEVVYAPKPITMPSVRRSRREYRHSTLFEGNHRSLLWEGLGEDVSEANSAMEVCRLAGLDYTVRTEPIYTEDGVKIPNMLATRRYDTEDEMEIPSTVYGVVTNRYTPVQNHIGFQFIDTMFNHDGFEVETAGQFDDGKIVWIEARMPERKVCEEDIDPYLVFTNRHDGKGSVRIFLTPVRIVCKNTLNMSIKKASRSFNVKHTRTAEARLEAARETIEHYNQYLDAMETEIGRQKQILLEDRHLDQLLGQMFTFKETDTDRVKEKVLANRAEVKQMFYANDLDGYEKSGFRFINAVSDWATHNTSHRNTANYRSNLFQKTLNGNEYIDKAVTLIDELEPTSNKMIAVGF